MVESWCACKRGATGCIIVTFRQHRGGRQCRRAVAPLRRRLCLLPAAASTSSPWRSSFSDFLPSPGLQPGAFVAYRMPIKEDPHIPALIRIVGIASADGTGKDATIVWKVSRAQMLGTISLHCCLPQPPAVEGKLFGLLPFGPPCCPSAFATTRGCSCGARMPASHARVWPLKACGVICSVPRVLRVTRLAETRRL